MSNDTVHDVTWLFDFATKWYEANPGEQISLYDWERKVEQAPEGSDPWVVYVGEYSVRVVSHNIIPCLAAISLDMETDELLAIMKHHDVTCYHISHTLCKPVYDDQRDDDWEQPISLVINEAFINVVMLDEQLTDAFLKEYLQYGLNDELEMAWLLCDRAKFWPVDLIKYHQNQISEGLSNTDEKAPGVSTNYVFDTTDLNFNTLTNDRIIQLLERSGNLTIGVTAENGFEPNLANSFFWKLLVSLDAKGANNPNTLRTIDAINAVQDEAMISRISARILESLCEGSNRMEGGARLISKFLDHQKYGSISENLVLNLNILDSVSPNVRIGTPVSSSDLLRGEIAYKPDIVLAKLCNDLGAMKPEDLRRPHFQAIDALLRKCEISDDTMKNLCKNLLMVALDGLDAYRQTPHYVGKRFNPVETANSSLERLIRVVASMKSLDYEDFYKYSSGSKALLATNGFDIKKLPGISRSDRGRVLSEGLGL
jgi:hypothetical protein